MFSKAAIFIASTFALMAVAAPQSADGNIVNSCNAGQVYCCNSSQSASTFSTNFMETLFGAAGNAGPGIGQVGFDCIAGAYQGAAGNSCAQQPVCCTHNAFNGFFTAGCTPVNVNL